MPKPKKDYWCVICRKWVCRACSPTQRAEPANDNSANISVVKMLSNRRLKEIDEIVRLSMRINEIGVSSYQLMQWVIDLITKFDGVVLNHKDIPVTMDEAFVLSAFPENPWMRWCRAFLSWHKAECKPKQRAHVSAIPRLQCIAVAVAIYDLSVASQDNS